MPSSQTEQEYSL